jgi:hypothetical protein
MLWNCSFPEATTRSFYESGPAAVTQRRLVIGGRRTCRLTPRACQVSKSTRNTASLRSNTQNAISFPSGAKSDLKRAKEFKNGPLIGSRQSLKTVSRFMGFLTMPQNRISHGG